MGTRSTWEKGRFVCLGVSEESRTPLHVCPVSHHAADNSYYQQMAGSLPSHDVAHDALRPNA